VLLAIRAWSLTAWSSHKLDQAFAHRPTRRCSCLQKNCFPSLFCRSLCGPLADQIVRTRGGETMHQFTVGEVVTCIPDMFLRHAAPGDYKIVGWMPDRDGDHMYRINVLLKNMSAS
jgi:hypothetical protein